MVQELVNLRDQHMNCYQLEISKVKPKEGHTSKSQTYANKSIREG